MKRQSLRLASWIGVLSGLAVIFHVQAQVQPSYRQDQILVKPLSLQITNLHALLGTALVQVWPRFGNLQVVRLPIGASVPLMIELYKSSGLVEYAEPDYFGSIANQNTPNDPGYSSLWGMHNTTQDADIDAPEGWGFRALAPAVIVAVTDTGVRYTHQDLAMNMWRNLAEIPGNGIDDDGNGYRDDVHGCNTINGSGDPNDDNGHGTHVAGTVGAVGNNGVGVVGVARGVQIMACKWIPASGTDASTSDAIECVDYAIANGAQIINASWRILGFSQGLLDSIRTAGNHGLILVAAAGNSTLDLDNNANGVNFWPAAYEADNIVSVAATTRTDGLASYSNWGLVRTDLGAPGGVGFSSPDAIFSTGNSSDSNYNWNSGTSMAAAHVSGAFALMKAQFPNDSYFQLINRVFSTTDPVTALNGRCQTGGRLNLHRALTSIFSRPGNDNFANSYEIVMPSGQTQLTATGNNIDGTSETGEPIHGGPAALRSVWWRWTATSGGTVELRTQGSTFNTRLAVYTGSSLSTLTLVPGASSVVSDSGSWSQVSFTAASGTAYHIAVDGYGPQYGAEVGSIKLTLRTLGTTSQTTLSFDRNSVQRSSGQFRVRVVGPARRAVTLDRFRLPGTWDLNYATFVLSAQGTYDYTDTQASAPHHLYRCQISMLKSCNAVGYADISLSANLFKMIANPLNAVDNRISALFPNPPDEFMLIKWDEFNDQSVIYTFVQGSGWIPDGNATLAPGEGMLAFSPTAFNHSFIGEVRQGYLVNSVPSGLSIRGSMRPIWGGVASALGSPILEGDVVTRHVNGTDQSFTYRNGLWINDAGAQEAEPKIEVGESFWITRPTDWKQISSVWP